MALHVSRQKLQDKVVSMEAPPPPTRFLQIWIPISMMRLGILSHTFTSKLLFLALCDDRLRLTFMNLFAGAVDTLSFSTYFRR